MIETINISIRWIPGTKDEYRPCCVELDSDENDSDEDADVGHGVGQEHIMVHAGPEGQVAQDPHDGVQARADHYGYRRHLHQIGHGSSL